MRRRSDEEELKDRERLSTENDLSYVYLHYSDENPVIFQGSLIES